VPGWTIPGTRQTKPHRSFGGNHHRIGTSRGVQTTGEPPTIVANIISHINFRAFVRNRSIEPPYTVVSSRVETMCSPFCYYYYPIGQ
jgi:hypothetical protein